MLNRIENHSFAVIFFRLSQVCLHQLEFLWTALPSVQPFHSARATRLEYYCQIV